MIQEVYQKAWRHSNGWNLLQSIRSDEGLTLETALEILYGGQLTLSTHLEAFTVAN